MTALAVGGDQRQELARRARASGLLSGLIAVVAAPAWIGFDVALEPDLAPSFAAVRLAGEVVLVAALWLLWRRPVGTRHPERLTFALIATVQVEIAYMIPRVGDSLELYLLGFSLAIYGSGTLIVWHPRWTAGIVGVTWVALGLAILTAPGAMAATDLLAAAFYLGTASAIAVLAQVHRHRTTARELSALADLGREQERSRLLLDELERMSNEDALTGLANRRRWDAELGRACADAARTGATLSVAIIDVDRFKAVNDACGHAGGDSALRAIAALLTTRLRRSDLAARIGGDEFGVLLVGTDAAGAAHLAEELADATRRLRLFGPNGPVLTLSIGIADATGPACDPLVLVAHADTHVYRAKDTRDAVSVAG